MNEEKPTNNLEPEFLEPEFTEAAQRQLDVPDFVQTSQRERDFNKAADEAIAMTHKESKPAAPESSKDEPLSKTDKLVIRAASLTLAAGAGFLLGAEVGSMPKEPTDVVSFSIPPGSSIISEAQNELNLWAENKGIDPANIPNVTYAGQDAHREYVELTGNKHVMPGAQFEIKVFYDGIKIRSIDIDPIENTR